MFTHKFWVKKDSLMIRISNNRRKVEVATGFRMSEDTLADALSDKPRHENARWRSLLMRWQNAIDDIKIELAKEGRGNEDVRVLKERIGREILGKTPAVVEEDVQTGSFAVFFVEHGEAYERKSTRDSNAYTLSCMKKFVPESFGAMNFEDVTYAWLVGFEQFMVKRGLSQNTRKIHLGNIRTAMREAYRRDLTDADPFRKFSFKPARTRKRSLSVEELRELFTCPVTVHTEFYRDMMALSFMLLGINSIDLYGLKSVKNGRVEYDRSKTGGLFSVKVEPEAMAIIEKYRGEKGLLYIADRWSDYRNFRRQMNTAIKRIGKARGKGRKDAEGDGPFAEVTSYWMRHTWATIAYELGVSDDTISQALGHQGSGARVTEVYIRRNMDRIDEANRKVLDWVLYKKKEGDKEAEKAQQAKDERKEEEGKGGWSIVDGIREGGSGGCDVV